MNNNEKQIISCEKAPAAVGPYSHAVIYKDTIYCSGQLGLDPNTNELAGNNIESQTKQAFENIINVLEACGSSLDNALMVKVYLADIKDFGKVNEIYATYFKEGNYPARVAFEAANLPKGGLVEIEVIAGK